MKRPKRILLYGFGPYREFRSNITAQIIKSLPRQAGLKKVVFPVRFDRAQFVDVIKRTKPDIVLGLGQSSRRRIDIEKQAANCRSVGPGGSSRVISPSGPRRIKTTLKVAAGRQAGNSPSAGDYVCNFSMYVILDYMRRSGLAISYGFIHVPHDYNPKKATRLIRGILSRCRRQ